MNASRFIAGKLRFEGKVAVVSIAVSFLIMVLATAISSGFRKELRDGIAALSGDIQLTPPDMNYLGESSPVSLDSTILNAISIPEMSEYAGVVYRAGIVRASDGIHGVLFKGEKANEDSLKVIVPARLAAMLSLKTGDDLPSYFIGEKVKVRKFKIAGIYSGILNGDDNLVIKAGLKDMQRLNGWEENEVSAIELRLKDSARDAYSMAEAGMEISTRALESDDLPISKAPVVQTSKERFPQIFAWLDLIDFNVVMILILMTAVAGFNMISGLLILLFRNISTIGTLKALGMTDKAISELFLRVASVLVLKGMAVGNGLAIAFCLIQKNTHLIKLNPENYFISFVPVGIDIPAILAADALAYIVIMLLLLIPCLFISKVDPATTIRVQ